MKKYLFFILVLFFFSTVIFARGVFAANTSGTAGSGGVGDVEPVKLTNPVTIANDSTGAPDINILIGKIINAVLGVVGSIALAMFVYGGLVWMTAAGAAEKVKKGRDILIWATIGLIVIFTAYAMVSFVLTNVIA
jgi:hypothetical protein